MGFYTFVNDKEPFGFVFRAIGNNQNLNKITFTKGKFSDIMQHRQDILQQPARCQNLTHLEFQGCDMNGDLFPLVSSILPALQTTDLQACEFDHGEGDPIRHTKIVLPHSQIKSLSLTDNLDMRLEKGLIAAGSLADYVLMVLVKIGDSITRRFVCILQKKRSLVYVK